MSRDTMFIYQLQIKFWEKKEDQSETTQAPVEKSESFEAFAKTVAVKKFHDEWKKKGFTKRGVSKLLILLWPMHKSNKGVIQAAKDILSCLKGEDALGRLLGALKLVPESIMK